MKKYVFIALLLLQIFNVYCQEGYIIPNCRILDLIPVENKSLVLCWADYPDTVVNRLLLINKNWEIEKDIQIKHPTAEWELGQSLAFDSITKNIYISSNYLESGFDGDCYFRIQTLNNNLEQIYDTSFYYGIGFGVRNIEGSLIDKNRQIAYLTLQTNSGLPSSQIFVYNTDSNIIKKSESYSQTFHKDLTKNLNGDGFIVLNRQFYNFDTSLKLTATSDRLEDSSPSSVQSTGDQIKILDDTSYVMFSTLKLFPDILNIDRSYHAGILYKLNQDLEVTAYDTFGVKNEFPATQNAIAISPYHIFVGSKNYNEFAVTGQPSEVHTYFRIGMTDHHIKKKWNILVGFEDEHFEDLFGVEATADGCVLAYGTYVEDAVPSTFHNGFIIKIDTLGNIVPTGSVSVNEESKLWSVLTYPNPASDYFQIKISNISTGVDIYLYDAQGKLVLNQNNLMEGENEINIIQLPKGLYFGKLVREGKHIGSIEVLKQ